MSYRKTFEAWIVAHSMMGIEVLTVDDREGQCKGGGKRVTFEALNLAEAQIHVEHCQFCWTDQPVASVTAVVNTNVL